MSESNTFSSCRRDCRTSSSSCRFSRTPESCRPACSARASRSASPADSTRTPCRTSAPRARRRPRRGIVRAGARPVALASGLPMKVGRCCRRPAPAGDSSSAAAWRSRPGGVPSEAAESTSSRARRSCCQISAASAPSRRATFRQNCASAAVEAAGDSPPPVNASITCRRSRSTSASRCWRARSMASVNALASAAAKPGSDAESGSHPRTRRPETASVVSAATTAQDVFSQSASSGTALRRESDGQRPGRGGCAGGQIRSLAGREPQVEGRGFQACRRPHAVAGAVPVELEDHRDLRPGRVASQVVESGQQGRRVAPARHHVKRPRGDGVWREGHRHPSWIVCHLAQRLHWRTFVAACDMRNGAIPRKNRLDR